MLHRVALIRTNVSGERIAFITKVTGIGELETTLAVASNRSTLMEAIRSSGKAVLKEPHGVTSQKTALFFTRFKVSKQRASENI
jgi:hypothetical protein